MGQPAAVEHAREVKAQMEARRAVRLRRFHMALASYALWTVIALIAWAGGLLAMPVWLMVAMVAGVTLSNAWFWYMLSSGRSLSYTDPSMTKAQVMAGLFWILVIIGASHQDRSLMMVVYIVIMLFGIFRLDREDFLRLTGLALAGYIVVVGVDLAVREVRIDMFKEVVRFLVLASCLLWCTFFGSHVAELRAKLRRQNDALQQQAKDAKRIAERDHLTSAYNRRYIMGALEQERSRSERRHAPFAIIIFDLDHFKNINDHHGHVTGDRVLSRFAQAARRALRAVDTISPGRRRHAFGRFGGEEFIALLPETGLDGARQCAERMQEVMAEERFENGIKVTFSAGIAVYRYGETIEQTLSRADDALYRAKDAGRDRVYEEKPASRPSKVVRLVQRD